MGTMCHMTRSSRILIWQRYFLSMYIKCCNRYTICLDALYVKNNQAIFWFSLVLMKLLCSHHKSNQTDLCHACYILITWEQYHLGTIFYLVLSSKTVWALRHSNIHSMRNSIPFILFIHPWLFFLLFFRLIIIQWMKP